MKRSHDHETKLLSVVCAVVSVAAGAWAQTTQYWDGATTAGYQPVSGNWSTSPLDANWNLVGGTNALMAWTNGNHAFFSATGGVSAVTVSGVVTAGLMTVNGGVYNLSILGNASLYTTNIVTISSSNNTIRVAGSSGNPALWDCGKSNLLIGNLATGTNNLLTIDGTGGSAVVTNIGAITLGYGSKLIVTNGGQLFGGTALHAIGYGTHNNVAIVSGGGSLWNANNQIVYLGYAGGTNNVLLIDGQGGGAVVTNAPPATLSSSGNSLIVTNGGKLYGKGGSMGVNGNNNTVLVTGNDPANPSLWDASGALLSLSAYGKTNNVIRIDGRGQAGGAVLRASTMNIGDPGCWCMLIVTNGGQFYSTGQIAMGTHNTGGGDSSSNTILVTGGAAPSLWNQGNANLLIGNYAGVTANKLCIDGQGVAGGAVVTNTGTLAVGYGGNANMLIVTNGGRLYSSGANYICFVNVSSSSNKAFIVGTNVFWNGGGQPLAIGGLGSNNACLIDGQGVLGGAMITNMGSVTIGNVTGGNNTLLATNGGALFCGNVIVGATTNANNQYVIAGGPVVCAVTNGTIAVGATWSMSNQMTVGNANLSSLALTVGNNSNNNNTVHIGTGTVWNLQGNAVTVGGAAASSANSLTIDQGAVMTNITTLAVYANNTLLFSNGTLGVKTLIYSNGLFTVGDGTRAATLIEAGGNSTAFTNLLTINTKATLTGYGTIAATTDVYGALSPGLTFGTVTNGVLTNAGPVTIHSGAMTIINIATNTTAGFGWGLEVVQGPLNVDGSLINVVFTGPYRPTSGTTFLVMTNTTSDAIAGSFSSGVAQAYTNSSMTKAVGSFRINKTAHSVTLDSFHPPSSGTFILLR